MPPPHAAVDRLKREECELTKHDSAFSHWKMLVGPSDWEDYLSRKEGVERYRTQNLPNCASCSGIYELGIVVSSPQSRRGTNKIDSAKVIPVYVGQAENVRTRLQQYGRDGSHLENNCSKSEFSSDKNGSCQTGPAFFTSAFSKGFSIVYRWAPMKSKKDAEKAEAMLLDNFDYAWNTGSNGARRQTDVFHKLDRVSRAPHLPAVIKSIMSSVQKPKGVKIELCEPLPSENGSRFYGNSKRTDFIPQIFKFGKSQPRLVSVNFDVNDNPNTICGVALGHGSVCIRPPVKGNKRCSEHRGMKVNGMIPKLIAEEKSNLRQPNEVKSGIYSHPVETQVCGFVLENGSSCINKPFERNKRCLEHKGKRITQATKSRSSSNDYQQISSKDSKRQPQYVFDRFDTHTDHSVICGVNLYNGNVCTIRPSPGRKRCELHKGMRITEHVTQYRASYETERTNTIMTCGAPTRSGSPCRRRISAGKTRCYQH